MDPFSNKRRKTSPSTAIAVNAQNTQTRPISQDGEPSSSRRASFMSPTKASLARFNPSLLPPSKVAESQRPSSRASDILGRGIRDGTKGVAARQATTNGATPTPDLSANGTGLRATPQRRSRTPPETGPSTRKARSTIAPNPRASPPDDEREDGNGVQTRHEKEARQSAIGQSSTIRAASAPSVPATNRDLRQPITPTNPGLPRVSSGMGQSGDGEPSLPSTPVHLGIENPPERPKGLLFSSPSRRPRRGGTSSAKSSPLKPHDPASDLPVERQPHIHTKLGPRIYVTKTPRPPPTTEEAEQNKMREMLVGLEQKLLEIEDRLIRQSLVTRWQQADSKEMKGLTKRKKEALQTSAKIVRGREELLQKQNDQILLPRDQDQEISGASTVASSSGFSLSTVPLSLVERLDRFLPFSKPPPGGHGSQDLDTSQQRDADGRQDEIAPFTITTVNAMLLPSTADDALQQHLDLTLSAPGQLLRAKLQVTLNVSNQTIEKLRVLGLSPWADRELGAWLRALPADSALSVIGTSFGRYYEISRDRAQCFLDSAQEFKTLIADTIVLESPEHSRLSKYLGRQDVTFIRDHVSFDVAWLVSFGDDGEVKSRTTAKARFPDMWRRTVGAELEKIGDAFDLLVKEKGAFEAIRVVCKLMFPTSDAESRMK